MSAPVTDVPLHYLSLSDVCRRLKSGEFSAVAVAEAMLARIERLDPELKAYVTVTGERALAHAEALDARRSRGEPLGPLHGVPIALKDLLWTADTVTTCGTRVLAEWLPPEDATVVTRLKAAGAVILGKVKLTEGAFSNHHPDVVAPVNPWAAERWTGVSSSGSGVSVAAGLAFGALGSDTGGSIRFPSACCGLVGIKPTYGRVSRHGAFPLAESLDHIGPMTRTVEDAARMLGVMAGQDRKDPTSLPAAVPNYVAETGGDLAGFAVGVDRDYNGAGVAPETVEVVEEALRLLEAAGARVVEVRMPDCTDLVQGWPITCGVECALAHQATWPSREDDYGPDLARLLALGQAAKALDYARLERARKRFRAELDATFSEVQAIAAPCMITPPPLTDFGTRVPQEGMAPFIQFTAPFDYSGHPTITLPVGLDGAGVPQAFQLVGPRLGEAALVRMGSAFEAAAGFDAHPGVG